MLLVLLHVWTGLDPVRFQALSLLLLVLFGLLLFVLAIGKVLACTNGRVDVGQLGVGRGGGLVHPLCVQVVWQVQAVWTRLLGIVGFVELQLDLCTGAPFAGGAAEPVGDKLSMRGRVRGQTVVQ